MRGESPLLERPLTGTVYLRSGHKLPDMVVALRGQIDVDLDARISSAHEALRSSFETVPDVPVSKFVLNLYGGKRGLLVNSRNLCKSKDKAEITLVGQNNRVASSRPSIKAACGGRK